MTPSTGRRPVVACPRCGHVVSVRTHYVYAPDDPTAEACSIVDAYVGTHTIAGAVCVGSMVLAPRAATWRRT